MNVESSVVSRVYDTFLAALEEEGQVDLAEALRPYLERHAMPRSAEIADLIVALSAVQSHSSTKVKCAAVFFDVDIFSAILRRMPTKGVRVSIGPTSRDRTTPAAAKRSALELPGIEGCVTGALPLRGADAPVPNE